jgi:hypothetical protein
MRNKKTKKIGGSRVRTANLLGDVKAAIPLHYTLVCTFQMHFNFFYSPFALPKITCLPSQRLRFHLVTAHAQRLNCFPKKLVPAGIRTRALALSSTSLYHYAMFSFASRFETKLYISFNQNT